MAARIITPAEIVVVQQGKLQPVAGPRECDEILINDGSRVWFQGEVYTFYQVMPQSEPPNAICPDLLCNGDVLCLCTD